MKKEEATPTRYWSGFLVDARKRKFLRLFPYTSRRTYQTELAGWKFPSVKNWWVLENGALCARIKFDYYGAIRGRHLGSQWEIHYYLPEDLKTDELQSLVSCIE
jgi:hypothetical protein